jgi:hypothetical protein
VKNKAELAVRAENRQLKRKVLNHVQPSEMIAITLQERDLADLPPDAVLEVSLS